MPILLVVEVVDPRKRLLAVIGICFVVFQVQNSTVVALKYRNCTRCVSTGICLCTPSLTWYEYKLLVYQPLEAHDVKLPAPPLPELHALPRSGWLTVMDAMEYLDAVKLEFRDQPDVYDEFLAIMGRFKTKQMLPPDVTIEVARLFRGRNSLVLQFNRFLPEGYKIGPGDISRMEEECVAKEQADARAAHEGT